MKNRAFTLIELLAVIVILAIIALIAVPIILNIIEDTKKSSVERSREQYLHVVEIAIMNKNLNENFNPSKCTVVEKGNLNCDTGELKVKTKGQTPKVGGTITIKEGKIIADTLEFEREGEVKNEEYKDGSNAKLEIVEGLTPVVYSNNNWKVADTSKEWYNYEKQEWANAVILNQGVTKNIGDTVDVLSEVKAMLVYIPRYEYKIEGTYGKNGTSTTSPGEIEVNFIDKTKTKRSEGYRIHPAFTFGNKELNGIWVGKFETTGTGEDPTILPSATSLRNQNVSIQFETSQKFNSYLTNGDSHMMKNNEWGAIAYLSQSRYGKYGNSNYEGAEKEVRINNCSSYITGIGADNQNDADSSTTCTTNTYETNKGQAASTTGNITGIYDMNGGSWEHVMGVLLDTNGNPISGNSTSSNSGYTGMLEDGTKYSGKEWPATKYYETYISTDLTSNEGLLSATACNGGICYGQALSETIGWYDDGRNYILSIGSWITRGGRSAYGSNSGMFNFGNSPGAAYKNASFHVVIVND